MSAEDRLLAALEAEDIGEEAFIRPGYAAWDVLLKWREDEVHYLLTIIGRIREAMDVGCRPMLDELPEQLALIIKTLKEQLSESEQHLAQTIAQAEATIHAAFVAKGGEFVVGLLEAERDALRAENARLRAGYDQLFHPPEADDGSGIIKVTGKRAGEIVREAMGGDHG